MDLSNAFSIRGQASGGGSYALGVRLLWERRALLPFEHPGSLAPPAPGLAGRWPFPRQLLARATAVACQE